MDSAAVRDLIFRLFNRRGDSRNVLDLRFVPLLSSQDIWIFTGLSFEKFPSFPDDCLLHPSDTGASFWEDVPSPLY